MISVIRASLILDSVRQLFGMLFPEDGKINEDFGTGHLHLDVGLKNPSFRLQGQTEDNKWAWLGKILIFKIKGLFLDLGLPVKIFINPTHFGWLGH